MDKIRTTANNSRRDSNNELTASTNSKTISAQQTDTYPEKEIIQQGSNRTMQSWLNYAETFITNALQQEQTRIKIGHKDIRQHCAPTIKNHPLETAPPKKT